MTTKLDADQFTFPAGDGAAIAARHWPAAGATRAVLVIAHGMGEHGGRYRAPLGRLSEQGVALYAIDHRGHGATAAAGTHGSFGVGGFTAVVDDLARLVRRAAAAHPGVPLVVLGHSMGSVVAQALVLDHADLLDGLALSGPMAPDVVLASPAVQQAAASGGNVLEALNAPFEPARTSFDWLSRDAAEVDRYIADPWCGFALDDASSLSMYGEAARLADPAALATVPHDLPIYVLAGLADPLHAPLGALEPLIERYRAQGLTVTTDLYPDARHEILNETNRAEVVDHLAAWLRQVPRRQR